jgi:hypothetical protein
MDRDMQAISRIAVRAAADAAFWLSLSTIAELRKN